MFNLDDMVQVMNGNGNKYKVVNKHSKSIELHCLEYYGTEEIQKGVSCHGYNSLIWVNVEKSSLEKV